MDAQEIVVRPLVTEKGTASSSSPDRRAYPFEVNPLANKVQIRLAIEKIYHVRVTDIRTANVHGKPRRAGRGVIQTRHWKKAIVKLHPDDHIDVF